MVACFPFIWTFWGSFKVRADFFSRADWWYAITAFNTLIETGGKFTTDAYSQAWTEGEFWKASRNTVIVTFVALISLMDNFRVFEPIIGFSAEGSAQSLSWLIYDNLVNEEVILFGSAAATSMMTIVGIAILLAPVLIRTWKEFRTAR